MFQIDELQVVCILTESNVLKLFNRPHRDVSETADSGEVLDCPFNSLALYFKPHVGLTVKLL